MRFLKALNADSVTIITVSDQSEPGQWLSGLGDTHVELGLNGLGRRNLWAARLDEAVRATRGRVVLAAESVSCFAVVWWARLSPAGYLANVAGALLLDPLGTGADRPALDFKQFSAPSTLLPFPSILFAPRGPDQATEQAITLAASWGSRFAHSDTLEVLAGGCDSDAERDLAGILMQIAAPKIAVIPEIVEPRFWVE